MDVVSKILARKSLIYSCIALTVLLACGGVCQKPTKPNDDNNGNGWYPAISPEYQYVDIYPALRPNNEEVAFVRNLGPLAADSLVSGLYLVDLSTFQHSIIIQGSIGRSAWLDDNSILVTYYSGDISPGLYLLNLESDSIDKLFDINIRMDISVNPHDSLVVYYDAGWLRMLEINTASSWPVIKNNGRTPAWSPTDTVIACAERAMDGYSRIITLISPSGSTIAQLTHPTRDVLHYYPSWNQSGTKVVFQSHFPDQANKIVSEIFIVDISSNVISSVIFGKYPIFGLNDNTIIYSNLPPTMPWAGERLFSYNMGSGEIAQITF